MTEKYKGGKSENKVAKVERCWIVKCLEGPK